jgi:hypothetical protein
MPGERSSDELATAIYGTILSTALIAAYSEDTDSDPLQVAVAVFVAALVFWVAHAYADTLARGLEEGGSVLRHARVELAREWPMVSGALVPILPLLLAPLGIASDDTAEDAAIAAGVLALGAVGVAVAWRRGSGVLGVAISAASAVLFGAVVVSLKALVH